MSLGNQNGGKQWRKWPLPLLSYYRRVQLLDTQAATRVPMCKLKMNMTCFSHAHNIQSSEIIFIHDELHRLNLRVAGWFTEKIKLLFFITASFRSSVYPLMAIGVNIFKINPKKEVWDGHWEYFYFQNILSHCSCNILFSIFNSKKC